jgi:ABC-type Fe3+-hydroxamate transport system substrate-binding protein
MHLRLLRRGSLLPALSPLLLLWLALSQPTQVQADRAVYATLGPEAPAILRVLLGDQQIVQVGPGGLADVLNRRRVEALILPEDWPNEADLGAAEAAEIRVVRVRRHTSIANMVANIRSLAALTGTGAAGSRWISQIDEGLARIRRVVEGYTPARVLVLTPEGYTQGQGTLFTELIQAANGINVAAEAGIPEARQIDDQQIRAFAPGVVLLIGWTEVAARAFATNPLYQGIAAFDSSHVFQVAPPGKDPARLVEDVQVLADLMHPAEF